MNISLFFLEMIEKRKEIQEKRQKRLMLAYSEVNADLPPNVDKKGRLHAPIEGYMLPESIYLFFDLKGKEDNLWGKGEFLPELLTDEEEREKIKYLNDDIKDLASIKLKCSIKETEEFKNTLNKYKDMKNLVVQLKSGKLFKEGVEDFNYVYFKSPSFYAKKIKKAIEEEKQRNMEEKQKLKGKMDLSGDVEIKGKIIKTMIFQDAYGNNSRKCVVELENKLTLYGTLPAVVPKEYRGEITFFANVSVSNKDETSGYYSRPKKVKIN